MISKHLKKSMWQYLTDFKIFNMQGIKGKTKICKKEETKKKVPLKILSKVK